MNEDRSKLALVRAPHFTWKGYGLTFGILSGVFAVIIIPLYIYDPSLAGEAAFGMRALFLAVGISLFSALFYGSIGYFIALAIRQATFSSERVEHLTQSSEELQSTLHEDFVTNLVRINFKYIDAYYLQTRIQADKSLRCLLR